MCKLGNFQYILNCDQFMNVQWLDVFKYATLSTMKLIVHGGSEICQPSVPPMSRWCGVAQTSPSIID